MSRHLNLSTALIRTAVAFQDRMDELQEAVCIFGEREPQGCLEHRLAGLPRHSSPVFALDAPREMFLVCSEPLATNNVNRRPICRGPDRRYGAQGEANP